MSKGTLLGVLLLIIVELLSMVALYLGRNGDPVREAKPIIYVMILILLGFIALEINYLTMGEGKSMKPDG